MKKKSGTELRWVFFNIVLVIIPAIAATVIYGIKVKRVPETSYLLSSAMSAGLSVYFGLCSLCWDMLKQEKVNGDEDRGMGGFFAISIIVAFLIWAGYALSLDGYLDFIASWIIPLVIILIFVACCWEVKLGKISDANENHIIMSMHENCEKMRRDLLLEEENKQFEAIDQELYDLTCIPANFKFVSKNFIPNILKDRDRKDKEEKEKIKKEKEKIKEEFKKMQLKIEEKENKIQELERKINKYELQIKEMRHNDEQGV